MSSVSDPYVICSMCGNPKAPIGRSAPLGSRYCTHECDGYYIEPLASQWFPREKDKLRDEVRDLEVIP